MTPTLAPPDPRIARVWLDYRESLRGLEGAAYEREEARAWDELQSALAGFADEDAAAGGVLG